MKRDLAQLTDDEEGGDEEEDGGGAQTFPSTPGGGGAGRPQVAHTEARGVDEEEDGAQTFPNTAGGRGAGRPQVAHTEARDAPAAAPTPAMVGPATMLAHARARSAWRARGGIAVGPPPPPPVSLTALSVAQEQRFQVWLHGRAGQAVEMAVEQGMERGAARELVDGQFSDPSFVSSMRLGIQENETMLAYVLGDLYQPDAVAGAAPQGLR
jgi:hypothetical protein